MSDFVPYNDPDMYKSLHRFQADRLAKRVVEDGAFMKMLRAGAKQHRPSFLERLAGFLRRMATKLDGYDPEDE